MKSKPTFEGSTSKLYSIPGQVPNPMEPQIIVIFMIDAIEGKIRVKKVYQN